MYTIKNTTGGCGAKNSIPSGNPGDILYLVSSGVAGAASNVFYTGNGNLYAANSVTTTNVSATTIKGTSVIGTHYGVIAGSNTIAASSITASGTSNFNARLNMNSTFELGELSGVARNILWGTSSTSGVTPGPVDDSVTFPTALSGTSYVVFMTPRYGSNQTIFTATIKSKSTTRFDFYAYRITGTGTTVNWDWMVIDYN
jgi:hypothetical protein